mmetsp:Transcript_87077/g.202709  ORF Transcript_87077/g.202709 Transcript_87077/m.202709 type:complete len:584 (-) Transcript_87077:47-1798(-)
MNFSSYFVLSTLVVIGIVSHAYVAHEQFYPAVVYLSTDKMCLAVMYNFAFALFLLFGKVLLRVFIGTLRDLEVEQLVDSGRGFLADTILFLVFYAPTIDNREVGTVYLIQYVCCVIFMKVFHLTTQIRVSHMFEVGVPRLIVNVKLVALMGLLLCCDLMALQYFYNVASRSSTFFTWILFEAFTMSTVVLVSICKYSVHMIDLRLDTGWPGKSVFLFYIDLVFDVVSMTLFLVFMLTFFVQNPSRLPIYMMADVIQVARKLAQRLRSFRRYRRISLNMEVRFPDASDEEIEHNEHCVICRDSLFEGSKPKKLPCGHIFHIDCLRSWLVMQQVCPTCRAEIPAEAMTSHVSPANVPSSTQPVPQAGDRQVAAPVVAPAAAPTAAPTAVPTASTSLSPSSTAPTLAATGSCAPLPQAVAHPVTAIPSAAHPAVHEIMDSLKRAEEIAKFLGQQREFWMDQVRQIEQNHMQPVPCSLGMDVCGFASLSQPWSFLPASSGAAASTTGMAATVAASAPGNGSAALVTLGVAAGSGQPAGDAAVADVESALAASSSADLRDQMVDLRRRQQEQWERKRSSASLSANEAS